jgi:hypothetical protein
VRLVNGRPDVAGDIMTTNGEAVTIDPRLNDTDAEGDSLLITAVTQGASGVVTNAGSTVTYTPAPWFFGRDAFTYTVSDATSSATATVTVRNSKPIVLAGPTKGEQVKGQAEGIVYESFSSAGRNVFGGKLRGTKGPAKQAIFSEDGTVILAVGSDAPGIQGATIVSLGEPSGGAVVATLDGAGVEAANKSALILGVDSGNLRLGIREGDTLPNGLKVKRFLSLDGNGEVVFLLVKLAGSGVTSASDVGLLAITSDGVTKVLAREGDRVEGRPIAVLASLVSAAGTAAEARWRAGSGAIGVRLTFPGKEHALYTIPASAVGPEDWVLWAETGDALGSAGQARDLGLPGFGLDGVAFRAETELSAMHDIKRANNIGVFRATSSGLGQLAKEADLARGSDGEVLENVRYKNFADPIAGPTGTAAFTATLQGAGVTTTNQSGVWLANKDTGVRLLARTGDVAPGGGRWSDFESLVFPDGPESGPIFTARLAINSAENVTRQSSRGLWAVDSSGMLQLLLRTGDAVASGGSDRVVKSFSALRGASGLFGSARGYDHDQHVTVIAKFADGAHGIVTIAVP